VTDRDGARKPGAAFHAMLRRMSKPTSSRGARALSLSLSLAAAATLTLGGRAHAGITMVMQRGTNPPSTLFIEGARMRADDTGGRDHAVIIDASTKRVLMIDHQSRTYTEMTDEDRKKLHDRITAMRAQMQERMKTMQPEQRKRVEDMMAGMGAAPGNAPKIELTFQKLGEKKTINGFACEMYRMLENGQPREEDCISPWSAGVVQKSDFAALRKFGEEMAKDLGGAAGNNPMLERMDRYPGIPISRVSLDASGKRGEEEQLKSVKRGTIAKDRFEIPSGYTKKEGAMGMGGPGGPHPGGTYRPLPPPQQ
jgi:Domain of unknown function (DUF4412)